MALRREHVDVPGGVVEGSMIEWSVKTDAEFRSTEALERMVIAHRGEAAVYLKDVARVEDGETDVRALARYNGVPTVGVGVRKQTGGNTVAICDEVFRRLQELRPLLPEGIAIDEGSGFIDFSRSIRESVAETEFALVFGGLLAVLTCSCSCAACGRRWWSRRRSRSRWSPPSRWSGWPATRSTP